MLLQPVQYTTILSEYLQLAFLIKASIAFSLDIRFIPSQHIAHSVVVYPKIHTVLALQEFLLIPYDRNSKSQFICTVGIYS